MAEQSRLSINQATTRPQWSLAEAIEGYAAAGIDGIGIWRDKLAELGTAEAARMLRDHGMTVSGLCRGGMFPAADAAGRRRAIDENRRAVDEAAAIGAQCLVIVSGGLPEGSKDLAGAHAMVRDGLAELLPYARERGMPLAIEPLHPMYAADRCCINTLGHANDLCDELGEGVGVTVDVYHVWWDPELDRQIARSGERIYAFHTCDWLAETRDLLTDRGMMGDGVIDILKIRGWVEAAGFHGYCEVEIMSETDWWTRSAEEVVQTCITRHRSFV